MTIRDVRGGDAEMLVPLFAELGYPTTAADVARRLDRLAADNSYEAWVRVEDGIIAGFAAAHLVHPIEDDRPAAQLIALVTLPSMAGHGIGGSLVAHFEEWARAAGAARLVISSGIDRHDTHAFYERRGYTAGGLRFNKRL